MSKKNQTLGEFIIENQNDFKYSSGELSRLLNSIRLAGKVVNHEVNKAGLVDITGAAGDTNIQGEDQQKLDVLANDVFIGDDAIGAFCQDVRKVIPRYHGDQTKEHIRNAV